jgi:hypothetical protein
MIWTWNLFAHVYAAGMAACLTWWAMQVLFRLAMVWWGQLRLNRSKLVTRVCKCGQRWSITEMDTHIKTAHKLWDREMYLEVMNSFLRAEEGKK